MVNRKRNENEKKKAFEGERRKNCCRCQGIRRARQMEFLMRIQDVHLLTPLVFKTRYFLWREMEHAPLLCRLSSVVKMLTFLATFSVLFLFYFQILPLLLLIVSYCSLSPLTVLCRSWKMTILILLVRKRRDEQMDGRTRRTTHKQAKGI